MHYEGEKEFSSIARVGGALDTDSYCLPCGVCRQLIYSLGTDIEIICAFNEENELKYKSYKIEELLPNGFTY